MKKIIFLTGVFTLLFVFCPAFVFAQGTGNGETDMMWITWVGSIAALIFALFLVFYILRKDPGTERMKEISKAVQEGAMA
ncbi:MAG: hypothetical protein AB1798_21870, partial [Spirochaetota bacterium]